MPELRLLSTAPRGGMACLLTGLTLLRFLAPPFALPGVLVVPLMSVAPPAHAACTATGEASQTYMYTAANIADAASISMLTAWRCSSDVPKNTSPWACWRLTFDSSLTQSVSGARLPITVDLRGNIAQGDGTPFTITDWQSGSWNNGGPPHATYIPNDTTYGHAGSSTFVRVPAGGALNRSAGTYSGILELAVDGQTRNTGTCEGAIGGGDSWDSGTTTFMANFVLPDICQLISTSTVDFGALSAGTTLTSPRDAQGGVTVKCSGNTAYTVYLDDGQSFSSSRRMRNGTAYLPYQLYKDAGRSQAWDSQGGSTSIGGSGGVPGTGTNIDQPLIVYGRIPANTTVPGQSGSYFDAVIVTVAY